MSALFACTKCAKRFPLDDLSESDHLCKECRNSFPIVKCTYCRVEFQQEDKNNVHSICKKCARNVKDYGKPRACEYCNIIAAFIGNRCQRCANSEKKWGPPKMCDQCKQQCAFERGTDDRRKVEGKQLCWLCTMAYKRVLAKALRTDIHGGGSKLGTPTSKTATPQDKSRNTSPYSPGNSPYSPSGGLNTSVTEVEKKSTEKKSSKPTTKPQKKEKERTRDSKSKPERESKRKPEPDPKLKEPVDAKKQKVDKPVSVGSGPLKAQPNADVNSAETLVIVTQLKAEVDAAKKQLVLKDQQLREKDKKITELKAESFELDNKWRTKYTALQKLLQETTENLNSKNRELSKQLTQTQKELQKKSSKKTTLKEKEKESITTDSS